MDFSWEPERVLFHEEIESLTRHYLHRGTESASEYWTREQWKLCGEFGLLGLCIPACYQGKDLGALATAGAIEAFGRGCEDMGLVFSVSAHLLACARPIAEYGSAELKETFLPRLSSGEMIAANAITEQEAGSDVFALKMRAVREGDTYILNGSKSYVSNGPAANLFLIYAVSQPAHGYLGISGFVIPRETPGLIIGEPFQKMGLTSTPVCQIQLTDCRVPLAHRVGLEGQGAHIFTLSMQWERTCLFAGYLGMMERQLEQVITYAKERRQFGSAIGKNQAVAHRIVDMKLRLDAARLLLYRACWQLDQGTDAALMISLAKLAVSEAVVQNSLDALQIHGAQGFKRGSGVEEMLRDALPATIFSGTSEMQRNIIANELGL